jgi:PAS domain S-box-containing protein
MWLCVSILLVTVVTASSFWSFRKAEQAAHTRDQTHMILSKADELLSSLKDAETGQRGYLLTGDERFLEPYFVARSSIPGQLTELLQITSVDAAKVHLNALTPTVNAKLEELATVIELQRRHQSSTALAKVKEGEGKRLMDTIRSDMKKYVSVQEAFALQNDANFLSNMRYLLSAIVLASLSVMFSAVGFAFLMRKENQQRLLNLVHEETQHLLIEQQRTNVQLQHANVTLQASEEKLAVTLNSIGDGVIATDALGCVTLLNPLAQQLTGWPQDQATGRSVNEIFHIVNQTTRLPATVPVKETLARGTVQGLANHTVLIARDGQEHPIADSCAPIRDRDAQVVGAVLVFRDVTEEYAAQTKLFEKNIALENATQAAEKANHAKSEFLATMSHEIRTPMNGVIGMIDVLQQSSLNGPQMEMTNIIHDSAFALLTVINDILDFSKIEANKLDIESIPMSVSAVVESACENLSQMALKKNVELTLFVDPTIPVTILGDPGRLRQVLINLANNAIKFSSIPNRLGRVSIRVVLNESKVNGVVLTFHVLDNGIGMDASTRAKLFTAFIQADASTTRKFGGTGLGLAISGQLIDLMGGEISVHSTLGQGSAFSVQLTFLHDESREITPVDPSLLIDLPCLIFYDSVGISEDLATYLRHDKVNVAFTTVLATAHEWLTAHQHGVCILADCIEMDVRLAELRVCAIEPQKAGRHFVAIGRGQRRRPRSEAPDLVRIDSNLLTRRSLLNAVAIAAGRATAPKRENICVEAKPVNTPITREEARQQGSLILVAEDNEYNQKVILQQLLLLGRTADIANNGMEAFERWQTGAYAILITDLHMPLMDGSELTAAIRAAEDGHSRIPIIAFTANALKGESDHCKAIGMDDYLSKPVQLAHLKIMLKKWQPVILSGPIVLHDDPRKAQSQAALAVPPAAVDVKVLAALVGEEPAVLGKFLTDFQDNANAIAAELHQAATVNNPQTTGALAHKLKSAARSVGATALADLCADMERAGKASAVDTLANLLPHFELEMVRVNTYLLEFQKAARS